MGRHAGMQTTSSVCCVNYCRKLPVLKLPSHQTNPHTCRMTSLLRAMFCCARRSSSFGRTFSRLPSTTQHSTAQWAAATTTVNSCEPRAPGTPQPDFDPAELYTFLVLPKACVM